MPKKTCRNSSCKKLQKIRNRGCGKKVISSLATFSLSRKTVNTGKNFWNVYCFTTNQMRDETAKDNCQTAME